MLKPLTSSAMLCVPFAILAACQGAHPDSPPSHAQTGAITSVEQMRVELPGGRARPPFTFTDDEAKFLDEIQDGAFNYLWNHVSPTTGMVYDRTDVTVISVGGVGFQLSAIPIGVERGWITREQGEQRTLRILRTLAGNPGNRVHGVFFHFLDENTGGPAAHGYEHIVSSVDSALFFAGAITAGSYFGGEIADIANELVAGADWSFYLAPDSAPPHERGFLSLGWRETPTKENPHAGELLPFYWIDAGDEQLLTTFLAVAAPREEFRIDPSVYYRLRRRLGMYEEIGPFVWFPWSGALFTAVFAHLWLDYAAMGLDDPAANGVANRARVDWWANSAMAVAMHRAKALDNPRNLPTVGENAWGLSACDFQGGYLVPSLFPADVDMPGARAELDYSTFQPTEHWGDGTVSTYGAAMAIMFDPTAAVRALRHYRALSATDRLAKLWSDPKQGGFGFADSFHEGTGWISPLHFAIDAGPMVIAIENARTGLVWREFHASPVVKEGLARLGLERAPD